MHICLKNEQKNIAIKNVMYREPFVFVSCFANKPLK